MTKYEIKGDSLPVVICKLCAGESMITESGGMSWMSPNMKMETISGGGISKSLGRMFSGESLFLNKYTAENHEGEIAFASSVPGSIRACEISPNEDIIVQKSSFLAATSGVDLSIHFRKKIGASLFRGEGFITQKLSGNGIAFLEIDGYAVDYELAANQSLVLSTGHLVMMSSTCSIDIVSVPGIKNMVFGGEGLFNTVVKGPGKVVLQTMPIVNMAARISPYIISSK